MVKLQVSLQAFTDDPKMTTFGTTSGNSHIAWVDKQNATIPATSVFKWIEYPDTTVNGTSYNG